MYLTMLDDAMWSAGFGCKWPKMGETHEIPDSAACTLIRNGKARNATFDEIINFLKARESNMSIFDEMESMGKYAAYGRYLNDNSQKYHGSYEYWLANVWQPRVITNPETYEARGGKL